MSVVLVVDDSTYSRKKARLALKGQGYEIVEARTGREGLAKLDEHRPDCILLDLLMPEMDGFEVLADLQARNSEVPVLVVSADVQEKTMHRVFELGARGMLDKAYDDEDLRRQVAGMLTADA